MSTSVISSASCLKDITEAKRLLGMCNGSFDHPSVLQCCKLLEATLVCHPFEPLVLQLYAEAQILSGKIEVAKHTLSRWHNLVGEQDPAYRAKERVNPEDSNQSWPSNGIPICFSPSNFKMVYTSYKRLHERGYGEVRLHFYIANLCKLHNDVEGFRNWLQHPGITDEFYRNYLKSSTDYFFAQERVWLQQRFFQRIEEMGNVQGVDLYLPEYFRCLAFEIEMALSTLEQIFSARDPQSDDAEAREAAEEAGFAIISQFSAEFEICILCQGFLYRENGNIAEAKQCFGTVEDELTVPSLVAALLLGLAHIEYELLDFESSRTLYGRAQIEAAKANQIAEDIPLLVSALHPLATLADAFAGIAACDRVLGRLSSAESFAHQALQKDPECGDALRQLGHIFILQKDLKSAVDIFSKFDAQNSIQDSQTLRFSRMKLDQLNPCVASQQRRERLREDEVNRSEASTGEVWRKLFDLLAEGFENKCMKLILEYTQEIFIKIPFPWESSSRNIKSLTPQEEANRLLLRFKWFSEDVGMVNEAMGALTAAFLLVKKEEAPDTVNLAVKILWERHQLFLRRGNSDKALQDLHYCTERIKLSFESLVLNDSVALSKEMARLCLAEAVVHFKLDNYDTAEKLLCLAIKDDCTLSAAKGYLGLIYSRKGPKWHERAVRNLQAYFDDLKSTDCPPDRTMSLTYAKLLCQSSEEKKQLEAIKMCTHVLSQNSRDQDALVVRASAFALLCRWDETYRDCSGAIGTSIKSATVAASVYYCRGRACQQQERFSEALADFLASNEQGNNTWLLWQNLAFTYEALGMLEDALDAYGFVIKNLGMKTEDAFIALRRRSALYAACAQFDLALKDLNEVVTRQPNNIDALFERGCVLLCKNCEFSSCNLSREAMEGLKQSLNDFTHVLQKNPQHVQASLKRMFVASLMNLDTPEDEILSSSILAVEKGNTSGVHPDFICSYSILIAEEILHSRKHIEAHHDFSFFQVRHENVRAHSQELKEINVRVDSFGNLRAMHYDHTGEQVDSIFSCDLRSCTAQRKSSFAGYFAFELGTDGCAKNILLASKTLAHREALFRLKFQFSELPDGVLPDWSKPLKLLQSVRSRMSHDAAPLFYMAVLQERQGHLNLATPLYIEALILLSQCFQKRGEARKDIEIPQTGEQTPSIRDADWIYEYSQERVFVAMEPVRGHTAANRLRSTICFRLAMLQLKEDIRHKKSELAIKMLEYAFRNDDSKKETSFFLGWLNLKMQRYEDSARWFGVAAKLFPDFAEAFNNLGVVEEIMGNFTSALRSYRQAETLDTENHLYKCNLHVLQLHLDSGCASDVLEKTNKLIEISGATSFHILFTRGFAHNIRNDPRREVPDHLNAIKCYEAALCVDSSSFHVRVLLAYAYVSRGNLRLARPHLDWLQGKHPKASILPDLKHIASKLEMVYASTLTDFIFATMLNPNFHSLHLIKPNVDVGEMAFNSRHFKFYSACDADSDLCSYINQDKDIEMRAEIQSNRSAAKMCTTAASYFETRDYENSLREVTKLIALLRRNSDEYPRALAWRALALANLSKTDLALHDAESALRCLGITSFHRNENVTCDLASSITDVQDFSVKQKTTKKLNGDASIQFAYALLCFLGSMQEARDPCDFEVPRRSYLMASILLPDRLEAHMNLANLSRKFKCYEESVFEYLGVLKAMAHEETVMNSKFKNLQKQLLVLMERYHSTWIATLESAITAPNKIDKASAFAEIENIQGGLLSLCDEFRRVADRKALSLNEINFRSARSNLMHAADKFVGLLCNRPALFVEDEEHAVSAYSEYLQAVEQLFESGKVDFEVEMAKEDADLRSCAQDFVSSLEDVTTFLQQNVLNSPDFIKNVLSLDKVHWATEQPPQEYLDDTSALNTNFLFVNGKVTEV